MNNKVEHFYQNLIGYCTFFDFYKWVVNQLPKDQVSRCVELGTHSGQSAAYLAVELHNNNVPAKLDLVDLFTNGNMANRPQILAEIEKVFSPVRDVVDKIIAMDSAEAASLYEDKSVDFLFIDASHEYSFVKKDIIAWKPKMKSGSIMAGHDFGHYDECRGVVQAVIEEFEEWNVVRGSKFYGNNDLEKSFIGPEGKYYPAWWVKIP